MPGEGAAALLLEAPVSARRRRAAAIARIGAVAVGQEPRAHLSGQRSLGEALSGAVARALGEANVGLPHAADTVSDLNGEEWRAHEYGHARVRVSPSRWDSDRVQLPAMSVGDIGAGMTALQLVLACRAHARGYARADHTLCTASDEYGNVGAAVIYRGE
jgi:3-oxoacyl-[acyl-carrier-protein] synthase-1